MEFFVYFYGSMIASALAFVANICAISIRSSLLQESDGGGTCPFCRCEIKGTEKIIIDSFDPIVANKKLGYETIIEKNTVKNVVSHFHHLF